MEHYCSLQTSQLLVKLGFKQKTRSWYENHVNGWKHYNAVSPAPVFKGELPRPTHAEAIEWLRKHKKMLICIQTCIISQIPYTYEALVEWIDTDDYDCMHISGKDGFGYKTPFKATEAALKSVIRGLLETNKSN